MHQLAERARWTWRVGAVSGVETRIHWTVALLAVYFAGNAALSGAGLAGAGLAVCALASVLGFVWLHEFGHVLMARRYGIGTRSITLSPLGGLASLDSLPRTPKQELHVALAGPAVNVVLAAIALVVRFTLAPSGAFGSVMLELALWSNVMLAVFNLLPAFPMDGGRVLRAWLEGSRGRLRATEITAKIGGVFAVALGVWGLMTGRLLTVLVAVFVWRLGRMELMHARAQAGASRGAPFYGGGLWMFRGAPGAEHRRPSASTAARNVVVDVPHIERVRPR